MVTDLLSEHEILTFAKVLADRDEGFIELAYQETGEEGRPLAEATKQFFEKVAAVALCQEGARAPCCTRDEGRPFGAVL
jgi:hypothetical protein